LAGKEFGALGELGGEDDWREDEDGGKKFEHLGLMGRAVQRVLFEGGMGICLRMFEQCGMDKSVRRPSVYLLQILSAHWRW
jgi:hypothetical protein